MGHVDGAGVAERAAGGTAGSDVVTGYAYSLHPHTLCDLSGLRAEIARVRMQGYALADRQIEVGLCSLAVPVLSRHGQVVAALNVGVPAATVSAAALKEKALAPVARGDGSVAAAIAPTAVSPRWRGCARSRRPAAEAIHPPSPAPGYEPE